ncbi:DUF72 domain-containing protein [Desertivirga xinjiangensis]|uniref:DUF72 domain-containing protein n=1 Tax=Desertivirga xinjiangensis TaxID=539206 RepID=UPI00210DFCE9|nr:DUF72 domain-containing protein [Pedobacter xinjiangensis]
MDFGKIPEEQLPEVQFALPADSLFTNEVLKQAGKPAQPQIYIGCAKWGRKEWVGLIYPPKTKEATFLDEYVKHFNSIELNAVFYNMPKKEQIRTWREKAEAVRTDFKFCPKFTRGISHIRRLKNAEEDTNRYLESIYEFGPYLGASFLQLADNFGPANFEVLRAYLQYLPHDFEIFVEVRHSAWFEDAAARNDFFGMLKDLKKGAIITDASGRRDCVHMELTTPQAFIRFVGNGLHPTDYVRIDAWVDRISSWVDKGLQEVYFFLHQHDEKDTPVLGDYTVRKFNEKLSGSLAAPIFVNQSPQLFT